MKCALVILALIIGLHSVAAQAHFKLNQNIRIHHIVHTSEGLEVYLRTPMSYLVAGLVGPPNASGLPEPSPFTTNRIEDGALMHYVSVDALHDDPDGLGRIAAKALRIETDDRILSPSVINVRAHLIGSEPGFATRNEAKMALTESDIFPKDTGETYVGDVMVDIHLHYEAGPVGTYSISNAANPGLPGQELTANLILDYSNQGITTYRVSGLMQEPVEISGSVTAAASTFITEGIRHILGGLDHVLFVLCMIIGAYGLHSLLGRVTGFTIGHTITLILGFFGVAPSGAWFIPTVEIAIALSIIFAAAMAVFRPANRRGSDLPAIAVTSGIGLLHGFGFSFMLHQILRIDAPNVWQSLLAFNIGVEIGQLVIVLLVWPVVVIFKRFREPIWTMARTGIALVASVVAVFWIYERVRSIGLEVVQNDAPRLVQTNVSSITNQAKATTVSSEDERVQV
ncbi:MAG: HupE/UreJ family protein [Rhodobacteraceae bacterium]|nr:HupE/UreJ family protein [Paracoccaceae bacterium]